MAIVYLARDLRHSREVAVKILRPELAPSIGPERFLREIGIAAKLHHPHILPLYDSGEADGFLFYAMPYVEGDSLRRRLNREKQLPQEEALQIAREIGDALSYAHSHDVVHRDIKPENVLLEAGHALVTDFGIARAISEAGDNTITETGIAIGTPAYMSPEQGAGDRNVDGRSDIYSLGCVLYEMLAGQPPFVGPTAASVARQHLSVESPKVTNLRPGVPRLVVDALTKALEKTPADRFTTASQFVDAIKESRLSQEALAAERKPLKGWVIAAVAIMAAAVLIVAGTRWDASRSSPASDVVPTHRDWILVAGFVGSAEPAHLAMAQGLVATVLDQSSVVATLPSDQIQRGLVLAGRSDTSALTPPLARELAVRGAIGAVVNGQIDRAGQTYSVILRVVNANDGSVVAAANGMAMDDDALIPIIDSLARSLLAPLGERHEVQAAHRPLVEVATPSFAAYRKYAEATEFHAQRNWLAARRLAREALVLDPEFAAAFRLLGYTYFNSGQFDSARIAFGEARRRPERLTEQERLNLDAFTTYVIDGDADAALTAYDQLLALNPTLPTAQTQRAGVLFLLGRYEEALAGYYTAIDLSPFGPSQLNLSNLFGTLLNLGRVEEADSILELLESETRRTSAVELALAHHQWTEAEEMARALYEDPSTPPFLAMPAGIWLSSALSVRGAVDAADSVLRRSRDVALRAGIPEDAVALEETRLLLWLVSGRPVVAPVDVSWPSGGEGTLLGAEWKAAAGDSTGARVLWNSADPTGAASVHRSMVDGLAAYGTGNWPGVITALRARAARGTRTGTPGTQLERWLVATAFERAGMPDSAITYFTLVVEPQRIDWLERFRHGVAFTFAHYRLARLYRDLGQSAEGVRHARLAADLWTTPDAAIQPLRAEMTQVTPD